MMFGLSLFEIIFLAGLALIVLGPKQLPEVARALGRFMTELRRTSNMMMANLEESAKPDYVKKNTAPPRPPPADFHAGHSSEGPHHHVDLPVDSSFDPQANPNDLDPVFDHHVNPAHSTSRPVEQNSDAFPDEHSDPVAQARQKRALLTADPFAERASDAAKPDESTATSPTVQEKKS